MPCCKRRGKRAAAAMCSATCLPASRPSCQQGGRLLRVQHATHCTRRSLRVCLLLCRCPCSPSTNQPPSEEMRALDIRRSSSVKCCTICRSRGEAPAGSAEPGEQGMARLATANPECRKRAFRHRCPASRTDALQVSPSAPRQSQRRLRLSAANEQASGPAQKTHVDE